MRVPKIDVNDAKAIVCAGPPILPPAKGQSTAARICACCKSDLDKNDGKHFFACPWPRFESYVATLEQATKVRKERRSRKPAAPAATETPPAQGS